MAIMSHQIGKALCDALQLPKQTRSFVLRVETGNIVSVECEYYPEGSFVAALAEYELVRKPEVKTAPAEMNFDAWMRDRIDAAHAAYMARHKRGGQAYPQNSIVELARYFSVPLEGIR
ncbi:hypothetical protein CR105_24465 [Massilia eurypsychrophila]|uniref:Uncharacterized protein n=1 Tax=Massilia eurypsychrophila TaxID=1485217 RepID=A0A2G8T8L0_9BURK|nr:hypothetical protein [Massilia eurypsychrophila]PIL42344.1 hypothetical protein CR105_24465 [Massilia eurypsychrophila]